MASKNLDNESIPSMARHLSSFSTALVLIPSPRIQSRVNSIRVANDKSYPRWTSHITLIFPFVHPDNLDECVALIQRAVLNAQLSPFTLKLDTTGQFRGRDYNTVYLSPSTTGRDELVRLWTVIAETIGYSGRDFVPHMTLGQAFRKEDAVLLHTKGLRLMEREPLIWSVQSIACLRKDNNAEGRMKIYREITLDSRLPRTSLVVVPEMPATYHFDAQNQVWLPSSTPPAQYSTTHEFSVVTYNVLHDNEHPSQLRSSDLVAALSDIDSDIICLQEVTDELLALFLESEIIRSRWTWCSRGIDTPMESERNIVVFAKESMPFSWHRVPLGGKHKAAVLATFRFHPSSAKVTKSLVLAAIHLTAGLLPKQLTAKHNELQTLAQYLKQSHAEDEWIIAGDTNLPQSHSPPPLIDHICMDAWVTHHGPDNLTYEATYDPTRNVLAESTSRQDKSPQRYDRIYIKKKGALVVSAITIAENYYCSDHWPLLAKLRIQSLDVQTLIATGEVANPNPNLAKPDGHEAQWNKEDPDEELREFVELMGVIPDIEQHQRKECVIDALCRILRTSRDGNMATDPNSHLSSGSAHEDVNIINSVKLVLVPVGSFALGVDFPDSDIDCIVIGNVSPSSFWAICRQRIFTQPKINEGSTQVTLKRFVKDAAVQMMVLDVDGIKVDLQYCPSAVLAESWPPASAFVDGSISLPLNVASLRVLNAHRDRVRLESLIPNSPSFRLAFRAIKLFCTHHGIYAARFGYLGGIHTAILLTKIASVMPESATATDLIQRFFHDYATFDWSGTTASAVAVNSTYRRTAREPMVILSAERPVINVAANTTVLNVRTISKEFVSANAQLTAGVGWALVCGEQKHLVDRFLCEHTVFVKIHVSHWGGNCMDARALVGFIESRIVQLLVSLHSTDPGLHGRLWPQRFTSTSADDEGRSALEGFYLIGLTRASGSSRPLLFALQAFEEIVYKNEKYYNPAVAYVSAYECARQDIGNDIILDKNEWDDGGIDTFTPGDDEDIADSLAELDTTASSEYKSNAALKREKVQRVEPSPLNPAPKLRTSADIFNRLMWDSQYDASDYLIGYEDRFEGIKEVPLSNWTREVEDEAFVPFHRVVHFKTKSTGDVVWDRRAKVDKIFGSGRRV